jgi:hypothetical protein
VVRLQLVHLKEAPEVQAVLLAVVEVVAILITAHPEPEALMAAVLAVVDKILAHQF